MMQPSPKNQPNTPVGTYLKSAFELLQKERQALYLIAVAPVVLSAAITTFMHLLPLPILASIQIQDQTLRIPYGAVVGLLVELLFIIMFTVAWHRHVLRPDENPTVWQAIRWDEHKTSYLLRALVVVFAMLTFSQLNSSLVVMVLGANPAGFMLGFIVGYATAMFTLARLSFWLTAASLGDEVILGTSWSRSAPYTSQLILLAMVPQILMLVMFIPPMILVELLAMLSPVDDSVIIYFIGRLAVMAVQLVCVALLVTLFSLVYSEWRDQEDRDEPEERMGPFG